MLGARYWPGASVSVPALLVHGLASNARVWDGVAALLAAAGREVLAVDLRGHGASAAVPDPPDGPTWEAASALANAELVTIPAGEHDLHLQFPDRVAAAIARIG